MSTAEANQVVLQLAELSRMLDAAVNDLGDADLAAVHARHAYVKGFAKAFLQADGAMDVRKQLAVTATSDEWLEAEVADAAVRALRERIKALHTRIDVGRSLGAAYRAEISLAGVS